MNNETIVSSGELTWVGESPAPDFPAGLEWLNVAQPISISQHLRGKIVLLDFWTQGCINCIHIIPDLKRLETEYPESLVVIGVHSAKFESEGQLEAIRQSVLRYELEHPIVNDRDFIVWQSFGARAWPTLILIDPLGRVVGGHAGEGIYEVFQPIIEVMDAEYREAGLIDERPLELVLENQASAPTVLSFPGKVLADERGNRLFIADSNHNRILVATLDGEIEYAIGSGLQGFENGDFAVATFFRPQGMALSPDGNILYIADLENHAIRKADLAARQVATIAGTGRQALRYPSGQPPLQTALSSPWDLLLDGDRLYIAMSGLHQLWVLDLANDAIAIFAGSGAEGIDDGPADQATLAQPSGFAADGTLLYFTDPESSAIRSIPLGGGRLETIIGTGLFDFGDVDGEYPAARLQHAIGIAYHQGKLFVADTYNNKIKLVDPAAKTSATWSGSGQIGWVDGSPQEAAFAEPSGLSIAAGKLYIADTNNHLIRVANLETGEVATLRLSNLGAAPLQTPGLATAAIVLNEQTVASGEGGLQFTFTVPAGYKFNDLGPFTLSWESSQPGVVETGSVSPDSHSQKQFGPEFPITFPVNFSSGETVLRVAATVYYCEADQEEFCLVENVLLEIPVSVVAGSGEPNVLIEHHMAGLQ